ncbi:MAG: sialate O-acetylesterase [Phycisphaerae bacterium]|jgi:sialate O-acetylesterase
MNCKNYLLAVVTLALACCVPAFGDVRLPALISDNMVLQQNMNVPIWGFAEPGEKVSIKADWQTFATSVKTDRNGNWKIRLHTPKYGGPYEIIINGKNKVILKNVLIGEVWVCSGQSNMYMPVNYTDKYNRGVLNYENEIKAANYPNIRLFTVGNTVAATPQVNCPGNWSQCDSNTVANFSAVAYFFGRYLHKELKTPIGLIHTSWGGTPAESWTSIDTLESQFPELLKRQRKDMPKLNDTYQKQLEKWELDKLKAGSDANIPPKPNQPYWLSDCWQPSWLYNSMIHPIMPFGIRGAIWYQGESNGDRAYQYRTLFPAMIKDWRDNWKQGKFPFYFVQLANFQEPQNQPVENHWAELREAQLMTMKNVNNTGMAVTVDIGEADWIHPRNKQDVGKRLALWALAKTYGCKENVFSGPIYKSMRIDDGKIRLFFDYVDGGLVAKDGPLKRFAIAGIDRKFVWANADIEGDSVVVYSEHILNPVAVRYAWEINPYGCNLYNKAGLPTSPFRTDDWPGITYDKN